LIIAGEAAFTSCAAFDANQNGRIDIDDFIVAELHVLNGCR
jgi:hypothetical protein